MRPDILTPLFRTVTELGGIGPKIGALLARLVGRPEGEPARVLDLLFHLPVGVIDRRNQPEIARAPEGAIVTLKVRVDRHQKPPGYNRRVPYKVFAHDETGEIALTFFHANGAWMEKTFPVGHTLFVSGKMEWFNGRPSMVHPDHVVEEADFANLPLVEPIYPLTTGLSQKVLVRGIEAGLQSLPALPEWLDPALKAKQVWPEFAMALSLAHHPLAPTDLVPESRALS